MPAALRTTLAACFVALASPAFAPLNASAAAAAMQPGAESQAPTASQNSSPALQPPQLTRPLRGSGSQLSTLDSRPNFSTSTPSPYLWQNVVIGCGGFVTGLVHNPTQPDLLFARTDVGGAFRWDTSTNRWQPLTDFLDADHAEWLGVISLATDSQDPRRLYLACGSYLEPWAKNAALLHSSDSGTTWQTVPLPFPLGGNRDGRSTGERLQIDPHQNSILFLGTNRHGLWRSADHGATWSRLSTFHPPGVTFIAFDPSSGTPGQPTPLLYAGIHTTSGPSLLHSTDAGATWSPVPGAPSKLFPHHAEIDATGTVFLTFANRPGPNDVTDGAVWKLLPAPKPSPTPSSPATTRWINITPLAPRSTDALDLFGYSGLSLDPRHPGTLLVSTLDRWHHHDEIFRSTDGGTSWQPLFPDSTWDTSYAPYVAKLKPHWIGDLSIDPFNSDRALFVTGYGLWSTDHLTAPDRGEKIPWTFHASAGLEETVPLALASPPAGPPLVSAIGDIAGFRHDDLDHSPATGAHHPAHSTNLSIDFAAQLPAKFVRTHSGPARGALSLDTAATWTEFASTPPTATQNGPGKIAISADGHRLVWLPRKSIPYWSTDDGASWTPSEGGPVSSQDFRPDSPVADRVAPGLFYLYTQQDGSLHISHDGGAHWEKSKTSLPPLGASPQAVPGHRGHLWLPTPEGLQRSTDGGLTFTPLPGVGPAHQVGFGRAAPGAAYPAVFLVGRIAQTSGTFRSDDAGLTWIRIDDDLHRFGWINAIIGDPRIHGRVYLATGGRGIIRGDPR